MKPTICFAASGSGGHLFPALHIARALTQARPDLSIHFVGAGRPLEQELVAPHFPLHVVRAARVMQQGWRAPMNVLCAAPQGFAQLRALFAELRPQVVVGVGGYASVFPVLFAKWCGIPTLIHEAEQKPGMANRVLAPFASVVSVARPECFIWGARERVCFGQPMRADLLGVRPCDPEQPRSLLVMGGSQGAASLDRAAAAIAQVARQHSLSVVHQTRRDAVEKVRAAYQEHAVQSEVVEFLRDMPRVYAASDIVISRAGASTVAELEVVGRPVIFVPYPHAQGGHQRENAQKLVDRGQALVCEELAATQELSANASETFEVRLQTMLAQVAGELGQYQRMRRVPAPTLNSEAAGRIAQRILRLIEPQR